MSSNAVPSVLLSDWDKRLQMVANTATRLQTLRDQVISDRDTKRLDIEKLSEKASVLAKVSELYKILMDKLVLDQVQSIESIVSEGLKTIFFDQDLSFKAELSQKRNLINVDFFLCQGDPENGGIKGPPLESFGGGPSSVVSLILRILTLLRMKRKTVMLLDETLAAVSDEYIELTGQFLHSLAQKVKVDLLLVTHKQSFLDHANVSYQGDKGPDSDFKVRKIRG